MSAEYGFYCGSLCPWCRHLDFTFRARAGTLSKRVREAILEVASVGALLLGFEVKLGLVRCICLLASMLQRLLMSPPRLLVPLGLLLFVQFGPLRCLLLMPHAVLNLLDGPVDVDPAFHIIWSMFRMIRRYLAHCPEEEPRIFRMLDFISRGAQGHGPVHLLFISAAELGFSWDGDEKGWVRVSLPPLRMMSGPVQHFRSANLDAWRFHVFSRLSERKVFFWMSICKFSRLFATTYLFPPAGTRLHVVKGHVVWRSLERNPSWQGQKGRRSLSILW